MLMKELRIAILLIAGLMLLPVSALAADGGIVVDGSARDWDAAGVESVTVQDTSALQGIDVTKWRAARDEDGNLYLCLEGNANAHQDLNQVSITLDGQAVQFKTLMNYTEGVESVYLCDAKTDQAAPFVMEMMIGADYFQKENYTISFAGAGYTADMIPVLSGDTPAAYALAAYDGIVIDGHFEDWDGVSKNTVSSVNGWGDNCLDGAAMVFDGDYVYIYLHEAFANGGSSTGTICDGRYFISTDLGRSMSFQLAQNGDIYGVNNATAKHVGSQWEIAIPAGELPLYKETISFGVYIGEPLISDVGNMQGGSGNAGRFNGIVIDGLYGDWDAYPHTLVHYEGWYKTEEPNAEGALYYADGKLYVHVSTTNQQQLMDRSSNLLLGIAVAFNGDRDYKYQPDMGNFYPQFVGIDEWGNVFIADASTRQGNGNYTYYVFDTRTGIQYDANWVRENAMGVAKFNVTGVKDQLEFELYMDKIAEYTGMDEEDIKTLEIQFGPLGNQWIMASGASSGPLVGVVLCLAVIAAGGAWYSRKRRVGAK